MQRAARGGPGSIGIWEGSGEVGDVTRPAMEGWWRIGQDLAGAAAAVADFHMLAENVRRVGATVVAPATGARDATYAAAALARFCGRAHGFATARR